MSDSDSEAEARLSEKAEEFEEQAEQYREWADELDDGSDLKAVYLGKAEAYEGAKEMVSEGLGDG